MKRSNESFIPISLQPDLYEAIYPHLHPETKHACSLVDKKWFGVSSKFARELSFTAQGTKDLETVYVDLLKRYPFVQKLTFRACQNEKQIRYLSEHPVFVKALDVQELKWDSLELYQELNGAFLKGLSHPGLESFIWRSKDNITRLTDEALQPILEEATALKHFQIEGAFVSNGDFNLSFEKQSQLVSVVLNVGRISEATLTSLNGCKTLETLVLPGYLEPSRTIPLLANKKWTLKHLDVKLPCYTFWITLNMPNLETLIMQGCNVDRDFEGLVRHCPKLKNLEVRNLHVNNDSLEKLLQGLLNLESFIFRGPNRLTDEIKETVKRNCPKLNFASSMKDKRWNILSFYPS